MHTLLHLLGSVEQSSVTHLAFAKMEKFQINRSLLKDMERGFQSDTMPTVQAPLAASMHW